MKKIIWLFPVLFILFACTLQDNSFQIIPFETLASGQYSGLTEKTNQLINSQKELDSVWQKIYSIQIPVPPLPEIDFSQNSLILAARGEQKTSGYDIKIIEIKTTTQSTEISLEQINPAQGNILLPALTQPFILVKTTKINKPVQFVETKN
ncbi:protease complex subunit PrcB family protein [Candidatus Woesearchaeota archaeon]|nr:protease complex subunit PrcB family protein [Candidatus Woesearchaeota archaeon]